MRAGRKAVIAHPAEAAAEEPFPTVAGRALGSFARPWRLPTLAAGLYDAWAARTVPVLALDAETGRVVGRLALPAAGPTVDADFRPDRAAVATAGRVYVLK